MKKRISWASRCSLAPLCSPRRVWSPGAQSSLMLICSSWVWWWSRIRVFVAVLAGGRAVDQHRSCAAAHMKVPRAAVPKVTRGLCVQECPSTRGAAHTCSGLISKKQSKDSQNNTRRIEMLFLFLNKKWGVSWLIHIFQVPTPISITGRSRTDRNGLRNGDLPVVLSRAHVILSYCSQNHCC